MSTFVARVTVVEVLDDGAGEIELTDMTVHDRNPSKLSDRVAEVLSYTLKIGDEK